MINGVNGNEENVIVNVGFAGEMRPVKFKGELILETENKTNSGPNSNRWHEWALYRCGDDYRVVDYFRTCWQGEASHRSISKMLSPKEVVKDFPRVGSEAIEQGYFKAEEVAEELTDNEGAEEGE